jgi:hypothetical protein
MFLFGPSALNPYFMLCILSGNSNFQREENLTAIFNLDRSDLTPLMPYATSEVMSVFYDPAIIIRTRSGFGGAH